MQNVATPPNFARAVSSRKFDIALIFLIAVLAISYYSYISQIAFPFWDGAIYLENAQNWLRNEPLEGSLQTPITLLDHCWYLVNHW